MFSTPLLHKGAFRHLSDSQNGQLRRYALVVAIGAVIVVALALFA